MERHINNTLKQLFGESWPTKWVTRERPKIDRIACPWLIRRFVDPNAIFLYTRAEEVFETAASRGAVAFDIPGAEFSHEGDRCSFDAFIERFRLSNPALDALAPIVRGADTDRHDIAPESAGIHAISLGLSKKYADDHELLEQGMILYDALYSWAETARGERHNWRPAAK